MAARKKATRKRAPRMNRAGRKLPAARKRKLVAAKKELRSLYGKD